MTTVLRHRRYHWQLLAFYFTIVLLVVDGLLDSVRFFCNIMAEIIDARILGILVRYNDYAHGPTETCGS